MSLLIARVSTPQQNLGNQEQSMRSYCSKNKLSIAVIERIQTTSYHVKYEKKILNIVNTYLNPNAQNRITDIVFWAVDRAAKNMSIFTQMLRVIKLLNPTCRLHFVVEDKMIGVSDFFPPTPLACEIYASLNAGQVQSAILSHKLKIVAQRRKALDMQKILRRNEKIYSCGKISNKMVRETVKRNGMVYQVIKPCEYWIDVEKLVSRMINVDKLHKNAIVNILNNKAIYYPMYIGSNREWVLWDLKLLSRVKKNNNTEIPRRFRNVFNFGTGSMQEALDDIEDEEDEGEYEGEDEGEYEEDEEDEDDEQLYTKVVGIKKSIGIRKPTRLFREKRGVAKKISKKILTKKTSKSIKKKNPEKLFTNDQLWQMTVDGCECEVIEVLDKKKINSKEYTKVHWEADDSLYLSPEENICWIPSNYMIRE